MALEEVCYAQQNLKNALDNTVDALALYVNKGGYTDVFSREEIDEIYRVCWFAARKIQDYTNNIEL